jgi:hypothetical protein
MAYDNFLSSSACFEPKPHLLIPLSLSPHRPSCPSSPQEKVQQQRSLKKKLKKKKNDESMIHRRREHDQEGDFEAKSKQAKSGVVFEDDNRDVVEDYDRDTLMKKPSCDWDQGEKFIFDGAHGECVVPPSQHADARPTWYSLEEGTCSVFAANATHLEFNIHQAQSGIFFSAPPHKYILDPRESEIFSDLSLFKDRAISVLVKGEGIGEIFHVGVLEMTAEGNGMLVGKRMYGDDLEKDHDASTIYSVVLGSVENLRSWSAAGVGMCTYDGEGTVSIEVDDFVSFNEDFIDEGFPMDFFEEVNAAIFSPQWGYEVFTIDKVENNYWFPGAPHHTGSIEGEVYFSTNMETWDSVLNPSSPSVQQERCFIFVDDEEVYSKEHVADVARRACAPTFECSFFGHNCLPDGCGCSTGSANCGNALHCIKNDSTEWGGFDGFVGLFSSDPRFCHKYSGSARIINGVIVAVIVLAAIALITVATAGTGTGPALAVVTEGAATDTAIAGAQALTSTGLRVLVQSELRLTAEAFWQLARSGSVEALGLF